MELGRRERKKQATTDALGLAALELAVEHGQENVTVEQIAASADVTPRTFFNHFGSKDEAFIYAVSNELFIDQERRNPTRLADMLRARPMDEPIMRAIRTTVRTSFQVSSYDIEVAVQVWTTIATSPALLSRYLASWPDQSARTFATAVAERVHNGDDPAIDAEMLAECVLVAIRTTTMRCLTDPDITDPLQFLDLTDRFLAQLESGFGVLPIEDEKVR